jgi:hypothetical protein
MRDEVDGKDMLIHRSSVSTSLLCARMHAVYEENLSYAGTVMQRGSGHKGRISSPRVSGKRHEKGTHSEASLSPLYPWHTLRSPVSGQVLGQESPPDAKASHAPPPPASYIMQGMQGRI